MLVLEAFTVDFEINRHMTKHLYCAHFGGNSAGEEGGVAGAVTFANWVPAYYRRSPNTQDIRHRIGERDACALWKLLVKVRSEREAKDAPSNTDIGIEQEMGYLTITEGGRGSTCSAGSVESKREVIGKLSAVETQLVLQVLDHRRNAA